MINYPREERKFAKQFLKEPKNTQQFHQGLKLIFKKTQDGNGVL